MSVRIRRGVDRFVTHADGWTGRYSFSYGEHYDADHVSYGPLVAVNEFTLDPGAGFDDHEHRGIEIVTVVLDGALRHTDDQGHASTLRPGDVQHVSAGTGVTHAEVNESATEPLRFLQMWLAADEPGGVPSYTQTTVPTGGPFTPVLTLPMATLYVGRLASEEPVHLPEQGLTYLYVMSGRVVLDGQELSGGDSAELSDPGRLLAREPSRVLAWGLRCRPAPEPPR